MYHQGWTKRRRVLYWWFILRHPIFYWRILRPLSLLELQPRKPRGSEENLMRVYQVANKLHEGRLELHWEKESKNGLSGMD